MFAISKKNLPLISSQVVKKPSEKVFSLPEKILQFGTGVLLRGLVDYFIDKANSIDVFNGRIVVVKSTDKGDTDAFDQQDGLYTICVKGLEKGRQINEQMINASVSRVLSAKQQWNEVLQCAANAELKIIVSNTTEIGISLHTTDLINDTPPASFPGKLLSFLLARYTAFNGSSESGMVIIPTELISGNGDTLRRICIELAVINKMDSSFIEWLSTKNDFCNSLVDRIVPGKLQEQEKKNVENELGYADELMIMAEPYRLWAIETSQQRTKDILSFSKADDSVIIAQDINKFRELKLRLLNGSHTFTCGLAVLAGFQTVKEAMADNSFNQFITGLVYKEIVPAITLNDITTDKAKLFAEKVLDRYRNPFIEHQWMSITFQYTSKMRMRNVPVLLAHFKNNTTLPLHMVAGFAAYLLFMKGDANNITDDKAAVLAKKWQEKDAAKMVLSVLSDIDLWGTDLSVLPGFSLAVTQKLQMLMDNTPATVIAAVE